MTPLIQAAASVAGGMLSGGGNTETKMQKTQRKLVDRLIASLGGGGEFGNLFKMDDEGFNKSFVEPAQARFKNKIAPGIQQQYIASGQQRGTGLEDQLLRAGVDLNSLLDEQYMNYQQGALNRQQNTISSILNAGSGAAAQPSTGRNAANSIGGFLSSDSFSDAISGAFKNNTTAPSNAPNTTAPSNAPNATASRKGYETDWMDYQLGDKRWGQQ